jgi:hypothetical protein
MLGTVTGIAIARGELPPTTHAAGQAAARRSRAIGDARWNTVTVQHLLDMTSGLDWNEPLTGAPQTLLALQRSPNWQAFILGRRVVREPGTSVRLQQRQRAPAVDRACPPHGHVNGRLCAQGAVRRPMGIRDLRWLKDPQAWPSAGSACTCTRATWRAWASCTCSAAPGTAGTGAARVGGAGVRTQDRHGHAGLSAMRISGGACPRSAPT